MDDHSGVPHQHHFLSRLDRLSLPHVELALSLYRAPDMLRYVLQQVRLPEQAPRVAISLHDTEKGPFLVVTREGTFVTCLGEGMSVGELPVVPRGQLDGLLAKLGDWRARADALLAMADELGGAAGIFRRLYDKADEISREELIAASALQPLYSFELLRLYMGAIKDLDDTREVILPILRRAKKLSGDPDGLLRGYWKTAWLIGNLAVLVGMSGPRLYETLDEPLRSQMLEMSISWGAVRQGWVPIALKGVWAAARVGWPLLPRYKRLLHDAASLFTCVDATFSLSAMACRHSRLRAEIYKALSSAAPVLEADKTRIPIIGPIVRLAVVMLDIAAKAPEVLVNSQADVGGRLGVICSKHLPRGSAFAFEREEDVPRDLALCLTANLNTSLIDHKEAVQSAMFTLPWIGRAAPEDLFLPRDYIQATRVPWQPEHTYQLLKPMAEMYRPVQVRPKGPARKGPCPCGSGKKYKRCCGEGKPAGDAEADED